MLHGFRYPLSARDLLEFCHPDESSPFHRPFRHSGGVVAANGFLAILCHRGYWLDSDYDEAPPEAAQRLAAFDFQQVAAFQPADWFPMDGIETAIRSAIGYLSPWLGTAPNASPVWRVGDVAARASILHLAARLPRAECAWERGKGPLWIRFSGGMGAVARNPKHTTWSREFFADRIDPLTRETRRASSAPRPSIRFSMPGIWPPPDLSDSDHDHNTHHP